jgi:hypothetical protein
VAGKPPGSSGSVDWLRCPEPPSNVVKLRGSARERAGVSTPIRPRSPALEYWNLGHDMIQTV